MDINRNYYDTSQNVPIEYDRNNTQKFILKPLPGLVNIIVSPPETKISIKGKRYKANHSGIATISLPVGKHQIHFSLSGYESQKKSITLSPNKKTTIEVTMYLKPVTKKLERNAATPQRKIQSKVSHKSPLTRKS